MASKQETLIYIEQDNKTEAEFMSRSFVKSAIKNRAYINALGAELFIKYLASEEINASETHNIHSISKILEKFDVSDILLPNIHIDVRVVFDENQIFIPKSHLQYEITPDIYVVLKLAKDFSHVEFLGYFEPKILNLKLKNHDYYFISKNKLSSPDTLKQFIKDFPGNTSRGISQENILRGRELSIAMADHNISDEELKELIELLLLSDELRESVLEFDNFETLSYSVGSSFPDHKEKQVPPIVEEINLDENQNNDTQENTTEDGQEETSEESTNDENNEGELILEQEETLELNDSAFELEEPRLEPEESAIDEKAQNEEFINPEISIEDNDNTENIIDIQTESAEQDALATEDFTTTDENFDTSEGLIDLEPLSVDEDVQIDEPIIDQTLVEDIENSTSTSAETTEETSTEPEANTLEKTISDAIQNSIKKGAEAGTTAIAGAAAATAAGAAAEIAKDITTAEGATKDAIKLAGISGDIVNDLINKNLESQQENLNKIDYSQISTNATEVPEHIAAYDLSTAKIEADLEAEASGQFDTPKDLSELRTVEIKQTIGEEEKFEQETIDLGNMDAVQQEEFHEHTESIVDLNNLSAIDSPTTPVENLDEKLQEEQLNKEEHLSNLDFSNMSSFTINSDGSSPLDDIDINFNNESEENLVDFGLNNNDFVINTEETTTTTDESLEADLMLDDGVSDEFDSFDNNEMEISEPTTTELSTEESTTNTETSIVEDAETNNETSEDEETLVEDDLELSTQITEELVIDDELDTSLSMDDENLTLDETSTEDLNIPTETTLEELSPSLEEETLSIEEPVLDTAIEEPVSLNTEPKIDEDKSQTVSNTVTATPAYEEISPDALLDEVINNIAPENNESIDTPTNNVEETLPPVQKENNLPIQEEVNNVNEIENIDESINIEEATQNNEIVKDNMTFDEPQATQNMNNIESDIFDATTSELDNIEFDNQPLDNSEFDNNQMVDNQDWMNDTNYDNLQDIDIMQPSTNEVNLEQPQESIEIGDEINPEDFITEPDANTEKVYTVTENSTVISDMNFQVGEIPIDINNNEVRQLDGPEQLENLYNPNNSVPGSALLQNPGRLGSAIKGGGKAGLGIIGVILTVIIVGIIGFSVTKMMNKPTEETPQPITDDTVPTSPDNGVTESNTLNVDQNNVVNMDNSTTATNPTPALPAAKPVQQKTVQQPTVTPQAAQQQKKQMPASTFLEISKLTWEVPDYISYNQNFKQYFQAVGKSLKLSLTSDLLLATDYAYSDQVRVSINYAKDGTFKDAKILLSSGSKEIDNIVLQTVNQTLKVLKAPHSVGNDESTTVILKIYF